MLKEAFVIKVRWFNVTPRTKGGKFMSNSFTVCYLRIGVLT